MISLDQTKPGVPEIVGTLVRHKGLQRRADAIPRGFEGALGEDHDIVQPNM